MIVWPVEARSDDAQAIATYRSMSRHQGSVHDEAIERMPATRFGRSFRLLCDIASCRAGKSPRDVTRPGGSEARTSPRSCCTRNGQTVTRKAYPGYQSHFPPPAWLYYGYPHSGDGLVSPGF